MSARRPADDRGVAHVEHVVPFHDVDLTARVWHGHYYKYFEMARSALFAAHDLEDRSLIPGRYALYVVETRCRHTGPLRYGDRLRTSAWFRDTTHRLAIDYEVANLTQGERAGIHITVADILTRFATPTELRA